MIQKEIAQVVEKESEIIGQMNDMSEDPDEVTIFDFVRVDELFEEENKTHEFVENIYEVDNLIENCDSAKVEVVVSGTIQNKIMMALKILSVETICNFRRFCWWKVFVILLVT